MSIDWTEVNRIADDSLITAGIAFLVARQFLWRRTELDRMLRLPLLVIAAAAVYLVVEFRSGFGWVAADWLIVGELMLVTVTGTAMGYVTQFRRHDHQLQYRLTTAGVVLWVVFLLLRAGDITLADHLGADTAKATGLILLSFGLNRLAAIAVVRRRARELYASAWEADGPDEAVRAAKVCRNRPC